jgi:hypothetical protein
LFNPDAKAASWLAAAAAVAPRFAVEMIEAPVRDSNEIEAVMAQWGHQPNCGLIVLPDPATNAHRKLINELGYRLPAIKSGRAARRTVGGGRKGRRDEGERAQRHGGREHTDGRRRGIESDPTATLAAGNPPLSTLHWAYHGNA